MGPKGLGASPSHHLPSAEGTGLPSLPGSEPLPQLGQHIHDPFIVSGSQGISHPTLPLTAFSLEQAPEDVPPLDRR